MTKTLTVLLLISGSAFGVECGNSVYSDARQTLHYQLRIERMEANHHVLDMRARELEVGHIASGALIPTQDEVDQAFAADAAAWKFACRSPQVLELQRRLARASIESAAARLADTAGGDFLLWWRKNVKRHN